MILQWTTQAWQDMACCVDYIARDDPLAAVKIGDEIEQQVEMLADYPTMGRTGRVQNTRELVITGTHYIVAYRIKSEALQVLRILHGAQEWPKNFS